MPVAPTVITGELATAADHNTYIAGSINGLIAGTEIVEMLSMNGLGSDPAVSGAGDVRFAYRSDLLGFRWSRNGGAYQPFGSAPFEVFTPWQNNPPASAYATPDTRNAHPVLDFDGTTDEEAVFAGVMPPSYAGGGVTVDLYIAFTSATSGSVRLQAAFERIDASTLDIDADSLAAFQSAGGTAPGTSGQIIKVSITFTAGAQMDSLAAGEAYRLKIRRDADGTSGTDDITTDMELLRVTLREV